MAFSHGINYSEVATKLQAMRTADSPIVIIGTALSGANNKPILINSFSEFVETFGYTSDFANATLCEAADCLFRLYGVSPAIFINVLDPTRHTTTGTKNLTVTTTKTFIIDEPLLLDTLEVKTGSGDSAKTLVSGTDYIAGYTTNGATFRMLDLSKVVGGKVALSYKKANGSAVTAADIIGGVDTTSGAKSGLELIDEIYPRYRMIPSSIIAPGYSENVTVAAALKAKCTGINGIFNAVAVVDLDTASARKYSDCNAVKESANLVDEHLIIAWPQVSLGGVQYHLSTHIAALMVQVDVDEGDNIPYRSPSNHALQCDSACLADGTEIFLGQNEANTVNSFGIVVPLNFGGWRLWGNRTSLYPTGSDVKDVFIATRRLLDWLGNTLTTNFFSRLDTPLNRTLIESVLTSVNLWMNGLIAQGVLFNGSRVECLEEENPLTSLLDGHIVFHVNFASPVPAESISFRLEYDANLYSNLLAA